MVDFTIPPEAVEAVAWYLWKNGYTPHRDISEKVARAALLAALNAWPGMDVLPGMQRGMRETKPVLILPLAQEKPDV